jgi:tetratricopeptide (TPR) repeat protein
MNYCAEAQRLVDAGEHKQARAVLSKAVKENPQNEDAWLLLAEIVKKKEYAVYCLEQILEINPTNFSALDKLNSLRNSKSAVQAEQQKTREEVKERELYRARLSRATLIIPAVITILGIVTPLCSFFTASEDVSGAIWTFSCVIFPTGGILFPVALLRYLSHRMTVTNKRVIMKTGILTRSTFEVLLDQIEGIGVKQPLIGQMLGYGTLTVTGTGGAEQKFKGIGKPLNVTFDHGDLNRTFGSR